MASHYYDWRLGRIHYKKSGLGDPILLVHGLYAGASTEEFDHNIRALSRDFRVYAIDLLGFGLSDAPRIRYRAGLYPHLLTDFIQDVIGSAVCAVATGSSAPYLAQVAVEQPDLVSKLVFISPEGARQAAGRTRWLQNAIREGLRSALLLPLLNLVFQEVMSGEWEIGEMLRRFLRSKKQVSSAQVDRLRELASMPGVLHAYASLEVGLLSMPFDDTLCRVTAPLLLLSGVCAITDRGEAMRSFVQLAPQARLKWIERAGPWVHHDAATQVNRLIAEFLRNQSAIHDEVSLHQTLVPA